MSPLNPQELIEAHFLGNLNNEDAQRLESLLLADPELRQDFREAAALDVALRDEALESGAKPAVQPPSKPIAYRRIIQIAIAASILIGLALISEFSSQMTNETVDSAPNAPLPYAHSIEKGRPAELIPVEFDPTIRETVIASLISAKGNVTKVNKQNVWSHMHPGDPIYNGDEIHSAPSGEAATIELMDGSRLKLAGNSGLTMTQENQQFQFTLQSGSVYATVEKQQPNKPLLMQTANAKITVLGTQFSLTSTRQLPNVDEPTETRLIVTEGRVAIKDPATNQTRTVAADQMAVVDQETEMKIVDLAALRVRKIEIIRAAYGHNSAWTDATMAVQSRVANHRLIPTGVFNDLREDPSPTREKILFVHYRIDGIEGSIEVDEWIQRPQKCATHITLPLPQVK